MTSVDVPAPPPDLAAPAMRRGGSRLARAAALAADAGYAVLGVAAVLAAWALLSRELGPLRLPDPWTVATAAVDNWRTIPALQYILMRPGGLADALSATVVAVVTTVGIGAALGVPAGMLMTFARPVRLVLGPVLVVFGATPVLILLPFLVQWFGNGRLVLSGLVVVSTFVVITTVTQRSLGHAAGRFSDYARSLGAGRLTETIHVALPALLPDLVAGLRVALAAGWSLQAVAELMGGKTGAGQVIGAMANLSNTPLILAMVFAVAGVAVAIDGLLVLVARRIQRWQP